MTFFDVWYSLRRISFWDLQIQRESGRRLHLYCRLPVILLAIVTICMVVFLVSTTGRDTPAGAGEGERPFGGHWTSSHHPVSCSCFTSAGRLRFIGTLPGRHDGHCHRPPVVLAFRV